MLELCKTHAYFHAFAKLAENTFSGVHHRGYSLTLYEL